MIWRSPAMNLTVCPWLTLSLPSGGLSVWGRAHRLAFCRALTVCSFDLERNSSASLYHTVSLWGSPGFLFLWRLLSFQKSPYELHCWENSQTTFPFIPVMDWQTKWCIDSCSDTILRCRDSFRRKHTEQKDNGNSTTFGQCRWKM